MEYLFGPIPSRRLGSSLGVDLVSQRSCTLDCVYCECGPTAKLTSNRGEYAPVEAVIAELDDFLAAEPELDYITFSGAGEPTLHNGIGKVVAFLNQNYPQYQVALLTNGTLFTDSEVIAAVKEVDLIIPSLDAVSEQAFMKINRPHKDINVEDIINGLQKLQQTFTGQVWLELFMIPGVNDTGRELELFREVITGLSPDRIQVNTLNRAGVEDWVRPVSNQKLKTIAIFLGDKAEVIGEIETTPKVDFSEQIRDKIIQLLMANPASPKDIAANLNLGIRQVSKYLKLLLAIKLIEPHREKDEIVYRISGKSRGLEDELKTGKS
jgi:wyosine [tRNA(Phe)-imidazoG37] synthetase (radical SAM superfamily)